MKSKKNTKFVVPHFRDYKTRWSRDAIKKWTEEFVSIYCSDDFISKIPLLSDSEMYTRYNIIPDGVLHTNKRVIKYYKAIVREFNKRGLK